jgi:hypothetical protein
MLSTECELQEFILFCIQRRSSKWPDIYDEMVNVAGQRLFHGIGYDDLKCLGLSFAASNATTLKELVEDISNRNLG